MATAKESLEQAEKYCSDNLQACCFELRSFRETGILEEGHVRHVAQLVRFAGHGALSLAETLVKNAAIDHVCICEEV